MEIYTLTPGFLRDQLVDEFNSAIWVERYSRAGDVELVLPATQENVDTLAEGTLLGLRGSKRIMILETQSVENGLLTAVGKDLVAFFNERMAWFLNAAGALDPSTRIEEYTQVGKTGRIISEAIQKLVINPVPYSGDGIPANLDWERDKIDNLILGDIDDSGDDKRVTIPTGPLYDGISQVAENDGVGIILYLASADETGYSLKFATYQGIDRTSAQTAYPVVRLSPNMESLGDVKEIRSIAQFKNVVYVYYNGEIYTFYADPTAAPPEGWARRVLVVEADKIVAPEDKLAYLSQLANDALVNNNYIRAVDGQASPRTDFVYGQDYGLGDIIELEGLTGLITKARVTEFIRAQDATGERSYPTISVLGPRQLAFIPEDPNQGPIRDWDSPPWEDPYPYPEDDYVDFEPPPDEDPDPDPDPIGPGSGGPVTEEGVGGFDADTPSVEVGAIYNLAPRVYRWDFNGTALTGDFTTNPAMMASPSDLHQPTGLMHLEPVMPPNETYTDHTGTQQPEQMYDVDLSQVVLTWSTPDGQSGTVEYTSGVWAVARGEHVIFYGRLMSGGNEVVFNGETVSIAISGVMNVRGRNVGQFPT